ncbi:hypothetical protein HHK36_003979 [Tetracentron sinense]|uniref:RRM domain-containing protein n=1 Tax=Tetracentron sinense TaxID=13715 RepID=A0A834ZTY2_TETSI|nr:hypothetical protein HHK36_003979 [Tetracentron sinense]
MPPRAVRRPSTATATALKKRLPLKNSVDTKASEAIKHSNINNDEHRQPPKDEKEEEFVHVEYLGGDRSERLELEDNDPQSEAEDYGGANIGMEEYPEEIEGEEEEHDEEAIDGDYTMEDAMEGEEEEDAEDEHGEVDGYEEEHHNVVKERRKRKEFEIFVGGLDRDATEEDLRMVFSQVGEVTEVRLMKNPLTQKNKGFAFLRFATVEQARRAINELKHPTVNGKQCGVSPSQDSDTLFVGNICKTWTKEDLKEKLAQYGVDKFEDLTLVEDTKNEGMNRGFAFLDFSSRAEALDACKNLQKRDVVFGTDRTAKVAFADTFIEPDDEIMSLVKTIFLDGLPATWDEDRVKVLLKKFGEIEKIELARNMPAAKRTDFGFITFHTHDAAVACVDGINNTELGDGDKKVKVRARLSRPRQRGKSAKHARGGYLVGHSGGRGGKSPWGPSMPRMDSWRFAGRSGRGIQSCNTYGVGFKQSLGPRDKYPVMDVVRNRVGSRRQVPPLERSYDQRSPVPPYGKSSSKREYVRHDESFSRQSDFARAPTKRRSYIDAYSSRESGYLDSPPQSASRGAARRPPPLYAEDSYGSHMERPSSYRDSHSRYSSTSGSKRPHSAMEELHPRYAEPTYRQSRARFDYGGSSSALPYRDDAYGSGESTRLERGSHLGYSGFGRSAAEHSHGLYDSRSSRMGYSRDEGSRGDGEAMYSSYGRDYISSGADVRSFIFVGEGSYSSLYSSRRINDGYLSGRAPLDTDFVDLSWRACSTFNNVAIMNEFHIVDVARLTRYCFYICSATKATKLEALCPKPSFLVGFRAEFSMTSPVKVPRWSPSPSPARSPHHEAMTRVEVDGIASEEDDISYIMERSFPFSTCSPLPPMVSQYEHIYNAPPSLQTDPQTSLEVETGQCPNQGEKTDVMSDAVRSWSQISTVYLTWEDLWVTVSNGKNGSRPIHQGLTGYAQPGEVLAIMGPSGCGKSTLLDALADKQLEENALEPDSCGIYEKADEPKESQVH